jgi:glutaredoxin
MVQPHIEVYQAEWCPHSSRVRQRLTELEVRYIAVPVPADPADREEMRRKVGTDEIPAVAFDDGTILKGDTDQILRDLDGRFASGLAAEEHRRKASEHG